MLNFKQEGMLSEMELDNFYRLLRSIDNDSINLALKMVKTAGLKIKDIVPLYQELIHLCNTKITLIFNVSTPY